jgi:type II secretory pathway component PulJ
MTTLRDKPRSELGKKLQSYRADRPDEWTMDEFTRMAEKLEQQLADLKASLPKVRADAVSYAISECAHNGTDGQGWQSDLEQCVIKLEAGNE